MMMRAPPIVDESSHHPDRFNGPQDLPQSEGKAPCGEGQLNRSQTKCTPHRPKYDGALLNIKSLLFSGKSFTALSRYLIGTFLQESHNLQLL